MKSLLKFFIAALAFVAVASCSEDPAVLTLTCQQSLSMKVGEIYQITYTIEPATAKVAWESSDNAVAYISGQYIVANTPGSAVITGTAPGGAKATINVVVRAVPVSSFKIDSSLELYYGETSELVVSDLEPETANAGSIQWTSSDESVATVRGDKNGVYVTGVKVGKATITGEAIEADEEGNKASHSCVVTVKGPDKFTINGGKSSVKIYVGRKDTLEVSQEPMLFENYTWKYTNQDILSLIADGSKAYLTANAEGSSTVTVSAGGVETSIKVNCSGPDTFKITGWQSMYKGQTYGYNIEQIPELYTPYEWSTSTPDILHIYDTVSDNIMVTAVGVGTGKLTVKAGGHTADYEIEVLAPEVVIDSAPTGYLLMSETATIHATSQPSDNSSSFVWTSSDTNILTVTKGTNGNATVKAGSKSGTATVTVKSGDLTASCQVKVIGKDIDVHIGMTSIAPNATRKAFKVFDNNDVCYYMPKQYSSYNSPSNASNLSADLSAMYNYKSSTDYISVFDSEGNPLPKEFVSKITWTSDDNYFKTGTYELGTYCYDDVLTWSKSIEVKATCPMGITLYLNIHVAPTRVSLVRFSPTYSTSTTSSGSTEYYCSYATNTSVTSSYVAATANITEIGGYSLGAVPTAASSSNKVYYRFVAYCDMPDGTVSRAVIMHTTYWKLSTASDTLPTGAKFIKDWKYYYTTSASMGSMPVLEVSSFSASSSPLTLKWTIDGSYYDPVYMFYLYFTSKNTY